MLGQEKVARLQSSSVVIVGVGAVGGYVAEALARSGVGGIKLVDFDVISESNINRQLLALSSTVGQAKVEVAASRVLDINPDCKIDAVKEFAHTDTFDNLFNPRPDIVIDAIDSFNPKVELLSYLQSQKIPVISSMGAALKTDPSYIKTAKLTKSNGCRLARVIRKHLRRRGFGTDLWCVYSNEPRVDSFDVGQGSDENDGDFCYERGRKRAALGSLPTVTGIFGLTIANKVIKLLTD